MQKFFIARNFSFFLLVALSSFLLFWKLGDTHLTNWDEAWYADVSRTIAQKGNMWTPVWNGERFLEKPTLYYWLTALSYRAFGDSEFSARFVSALSGVLTVYLLYWITRRLYGDFAATAALLILISTPAFLWRARTGNLDSLLTFLIFLSYVGYARGFRYVTAVASGLAFLTKGFIGFLFPLVARSSSLLGAIVLSGIWFASMYAVNGQSFTEQFFAQQGEKVGGIGSLVYNFSFEYVSFLRSGLKLWLILFIPALLFNLWRRPRPVYFWFVLTFLLLLSFLREKSTWFLHPVYPFIALLGASMIRKFPKRFRTPALFMISTIAIFQILYFRSDYIVPDIAADEARVAKASRSLTADGDVLYLTHYYFPTAVYYSRRKTFAVYSEQPSVSSWILPKTHWSEILKEDQVFLNTTVDDFRELQERFSGTRFEVLFQSGSKLLVKKTSQKPL